ncbi:MAG: YybS family protein [Spirochaetia bacterium]|nr:YybS family protein [Spirochaetia bacterium]
MEDNRFQNTGKRGYIAAIIASAVSIFAYETGLFFFLFIVPLQLLLLKRGQFWARISALGVGIAIVYLGIRHTADVTDAHVQFLLRLAEVAIPFALLGGFLFMNRISRNGEVNLFRGIFLSTGFTAILALVLLNLFRDEGFIEFYRQQIGSVFNTIRSTIEANGNPDMLPVMNMDVDTALKMVSTVFFRGFLFAYFAILTGSYLFAQHMERISRREFGVITEVLVPDYFVWILIVALALVMLDHKFDLDLIGYFGWNVFLIVMFLYGLRGMRIIRQIYGSMKVPGFLRFCIVFCFVSLLLNPATSVWLLIGIPCIGISEIWVKYKRT